MRLWTVEAHWLIQQTLHSGLGTLIGHENLKIRAIIIIKLLYINYYIIIIYCILILIIITDIY